MIAIFKKLKHQYDVIRQEAQESNKTGKIAIVLGNSPSVKDICSVKLKKFTSDNTVDLYVCNGFFSKPVFNLQLFNQVNYFAADPLILDYYFYKNNNYKLNEFVDQIRPNSSFSRQNIETQIAPSLEYDVASFDHAYRNESIKIFVSYHSYLNRLKRELFLIPNIGLYKLPMYISRLLYSLPINFRAFPLVGPSVVQLMINHAVYSHYDHVFVIGDHDSDLSYLRGDRYFWERKYNYFFEESRINYLKGELPYPKYLRKFLTLALRETYLPEKFNCVEYIARRHYKLAFPNFGTLNLMKDN